MSLKHLTILYTGGESVTCDTPILLQDEGGKPRKNKVIYKCYNKNKRNKMNTKLY